MKISESIKNAIHHFLFNVDTNPCNESEPYPIKEILTIRIDEPIEYGEKFITNAFVVDYICPKGKNETTLVYGGHIEKYLN
tara:strand:- start:1237 stop:1479 length:243 start_codon:yes stop_codon:yes gene_type:complete